ncbi:MarR family transcriptional regulator [Halobaculum lipolyticum]|uniref:MarR family transcriptional regulator n=1 Tax=Halobaculum lipolyticum TaxID=3032001 RepID=A0ABD5WBC7_9EURY
MAGRKRETSDSEILRAIALSPHPVVVASELSDDVGMSRQGVFSRLQDLEDSGLVRSAMKASARVWWLTEDGRVYLSESS